MTAPGSPFQVEQIMPPLVPPAPPPSGPASLIVATAPYATPVLNGQHLTRTQERPRTSMWFLLYAQAVQADGVTMRNVLIATEPGVFADRELDLIDAALRPYFVTLATNSLKTFNRTAVAAFHQAQIESILAAIHLPATASLSVIAVELLPGGTGSDFGTAGRAERPRSPHARSHDRSRPQGAAGVAPPRAGAFPFGHPARLAARAMAPFCGYGAAYSASARSRSGA